MGLRICMLHSSLPVEFYQRVFDEPPDGTRKLVVSRNAYVVRDPNSRHAQLALSDDLVGRHGSLDTSRPALAPFSPRISSSHRLPHSLWTVRSLACL